MGMGELRAPTPATIHSTLRSGASGQALPATSEIAEAFARIDTNGDGVLSRIEVIKACRADEGVRGLRGADAQHGAFGELVHRA